MSHSVLAELALCGVIGVALPEVVVRTHRRAWSDVTVGSRRTRARGVGLGLRPANTSCCACDRGLRGVGPRDAWSLQH